VIPSRRIGGRTRERVRREAERVPLLALFVVIVPVLLLVAASAHWTVLDAEASAAPEAPRLASPTEGTPLRVTVARDGVRWGEERAAPVSSPGLAERLARLRANRPAEEGITVVAAGGVSYRNVRRVLDLCRAAGFEPVRLETTP